MSDVARWCQVRKGHPLELILCALLRFHHFQYLRRWSVCICKVHLWGVSVLCALAIASLIRLTTLYSDPKAWREAEKYMYRLSEGGRTMCNSPGVWPEGPAFIVIDRIDTDAVNGILMIRVSSASDSQY
jgi:hypothetical protein